MLRRHPGRGRHPLVPWPATPSPANAHETARLPRLAAAGTACRWWTDARALWERLASGPPTPLAAAGILLGVALVAALLAFGTFRAVASLAGPDRSEPEPAAEPAATRVSIYSVGSTTPTPAPAGDQAALDPPPPAGDGDGPAAAPARAIERLVIPEIGVDAPVVVKGLDQHRVMEAPDGPAEVVWYDFTAFPGRLGNAVFSGHLDFPGVGPAVFWRLREVTRGTRIDVLLADGTTYHYQVVSTAVYREATAPVRQIIGPTPTETITLITCTGLFDRTIGRYEDRLVVRAERIAG